MALAGVIALALILILPGGKGQSASADEIEEYMAGAGPEILGVECEGDGVSISFEHAGYDSYEFTSALLTLFAFSRGAAPEAEEITLIACTDEVELARVTAEGASIAAWEESDEGTAEFMRTWEWDPPDWALEAE